MAKRRQACAIHLVLIAALSLVPAWLFPPSLAQVPGIDKWAHVAMYGVLGALFRWAAGQETVPPAARWLPAAGAGYGLLMEILQACMGATRMFSWGDELSNLAGVVLFWFVAEWIMARGPHNRS
jgi:hypothetical protein